MTAASPDSESKLEMAAELREDFDTADSDGDGRIDFSEFKCMMENLDAEMSATDLQIGFREIDTDGDGRIELDEFVSWWAQE